MKVSAIKKMKEDIGWSPEEGPRQWSTWKNKLDMPVETLLKWQRLTHVHMEPTFQNYYTSNDEFFCKKIYIMSGCQLTYCSYGC